MAPRVGRDAPTRGGNGRGRSRGGTLPAAGNRGGAPSSSGGLPTQGCKRVSVLFYKLTYIDPFTSDQPILLLLAWSVQVLGLLVR